MLAGARATLSLTQPFAPKSREVLSTHAYIGTCVIGLERFRKLS
jgi:hypothetical protein